MTTPVSLLEVRDLAIHYPIHSGVLLRRTGEVKAVDGVSFALNEGETLGLVGESGCGKTTVAKGILRLVDVTSGSIDFRRRSGESVDLVTLDRGAMRPIRAEIQMIYQDPYSSLNPRWPLGDIVAEPLTVHRPHLSADERAERVAWLLEKVGLSPDQAFRYPHELSGGQRQRIGIARALATEPRLVVADEPVSALDVSIQAQVMNLMQDLQDELGIAILFIAHNLSVVEHISDRIAVMYLGEIAEIGPGRAVYERPLHPYTRALLSAVPLPDPDLERPERVVLSGDPPSPLAKPTGCPFHTRCPLAQPGCAINEPRLEEAEPGHFVACPIVLRGHW
ncbi:MAG TPA: oligopeptide/dipeptide ABC transporter ATP-binding protein [Thermoanaerobaculia bacterium]|nr:oligopeptide/dipeptide ABC transporter ATP-binding protein [Thermoanaerobaculia bacterium]